MKTQLLTGIAAALMAVSTSIAGTPMQPPGPAPAPPNQAGWFIGTDAGPFWVKKVTAESGSLSADLKFKTGWGIDVPVGYNFGNGFCGFLSAGYNEARFDSASLNYNGHVSSTTLDGKLRLIPIMANGAYHVKVAENLHWYIGAGAGTVDRKSTLDAVGGQSIPGGSVTGSNKWDFGWSAFTGLAYDVTPQCALTLGYRYMMVHQGSEDFSGGNAHTHLLSAGVLFKF